MAKSNSLVRGGSIAALVAVPALSVAFLGSNLVAGLTLPTMNVSDTREFNQSGQNLAAPASNDTEVFLDTWQNTVRNPPSPRI